MKKAKEIELVQWIIKSLNFNIQDVKKVVDYFSFDDEAVEVVITEGFNGIRIAFIMFYRHTIYYGVCSHSDTAEGFLARYIKITAGSIENCERI